MFLFVTALACVVVHFFLTFFVARNKVGSCSSPRHSEEFPFLPAPTACLAAVLSLCIHHTAIESGRVTDGVWSSGRIPSAASSQPASKQGRNQSINQASGSVSSHAKSSSRVYACHVSSQFSQEVRRRLYAESSLSEVISAKLTSNTNKLSQPPPIHSAGHPSIHPSIQKQHAAAVFVRSFVRSFVHSLI